MSIWTTPPRLVLIALLALSAQPSNPAPAPARVVIHAHRLVDPVAGTATRDVVVVLDGRHIGQVVPVSRFHPAAGDSVIDLRDATLIPGLIDAHVHLTIGGLPGDMARADLRAGFTTVADLGAVSMQVLRLRDSIAAGLVEGPRILAAGLWIGVKGGVCEFGGIGVAGGAEAFRARVRENIASGADLTKACVTGWPAVALGFPDSVELPTAILRAMVDEAHRSGRPVVAHALSHRGVAEALEAGVAGLVHAAYVDHSLVARMKARGMWLIPTLASLTAGDTSVVARDLAAAVSRAHRGGVTLVFGTDGGVLPHGDNAKEAVALVAAGLGPAEVLRAATANAARAFGLSDSLGAIRPGMLADLVAVDGDPLTDVAALQHPVLVLKAGRVVR